jgi:multidrug transporter EmrE-like cation transporter
LSPLLLALWGLNITVDTVGQLAFKAAASSPVVGNGWQHWKQLVRRPWLWVGIGCYVVEFFAIVAFLSLVPLSMGAVLGSINIVVVVLAGRWLFHEHTRPLRVAGIVLIMGGVLVVGGAV